ncbi:MAG: ABC transporter transmembrane domain-containing protein [Paracoccaceae bacterium]
MVSGWNQILLTLLGALVAALAIAPLELQRLIVNDVIEAQDLERLYLLGGAYVGVVVAHKAVKFVFNVYRGTVIEDVLRGARRRIYEREVGPRSSKRRERQGQSVSVLSQELEELAGFVGEAFSDLVVNLGTVVLVVAYMIAVEPLLAVASLAVLALQAAVVPPIQRRLDRLTEERTRLKRELGDDVTERIADREFDRLLDAVRANRTKIHVWKHLSKMLVNGFNHLATAAVLVGGGWLVIQGETSLGVVVAFVSGLERIVDPARRVIATYQLYARSRVRYAMIVRWIASED